MISGYYTALERTLDHADDASLKVWEANVKVQEGLELIKPGVKCSEICNELNELFAELGYHTEHLVMDIFWCSPHFYGRESGLELEKI